MGAPFQWTAPMGGGKTPGHPLMYGGETPGDLPVGMVWGNFPPKGVDTSPELRRGAGARGSGVGLCKIGNSLEELSTPAVGGTVDWVILTALERFIK